jgi:enamine deaminase RidA (YjgF/YER057c/UK114 family)
MKDVLIALVVLAYVIPFIYILIADVVDIWRRLSEVFAVKVKPALVMITKTIID